MKEILIMIGQYILICIAIASVSYTFISERKNFKFVLAIWKRFRFGMLIQVVGIMLMTIAAAALLVYFVPGMKYGWTNLIYGDGGNILIQPIQQGSHSTSVLVRMMVPVFFFVLLLVLPFLAKSEEESFRKGYINWSEIMRQSLKFGLIHCIVGVPLGVGLALSIPGFFFACKYRRAFILSTWESEDVSQAEDEAIMVSTTYHTIYNVVVVTLLLIFALVAI